MSDLSGLTDKEIFQAFVNCLYDGIRGHVCDLDHKRDKPPGFKWMQLDMNKYWTQMSQRGTAGVGNYRDTGPS